MIARFRVLLPFEFSVRIDQSLTAAEFRIDGYLIRVLPPYQAKASLRDVVDPTTTPYQVTLNLGPADTPAIDPTITIDGKPTLLANVVQIDVNKPEFDRRKNLEDGSPNPGDPPISLFFDVLNSLLRRLRSKGRAANVRTLNADDVLWRLEFLDDKEVRVERSEERYRAKGHLHVSGRITAMWDRSWSDAIELPRDYELRAWEALLLDGEALLPDMIPALMLTAAGIESLVRTSLSVLAPDKGQAADLWVYLTNREHPTQKPSVADEATTLLKALTGHSLEEQKDLWRAFNELRQVRNNLMHNGVLATGKKVKYSVDREKAYWLVTKAKEVADWIEQLLPETYRRPAILPPIQLQYHRVLIHEADVPNERPYQ